MPFLTLSPTFSVSGQITPEDIAVAKDAGFDLIINNRPDHEDVEQPLAADIEAAADRHGLNYVFIPIGRDGIRETDLAKLTTAIEGATKTLAFCRTGTRSTILRAYSCAHNGTPIQDLIDEAGRAGYDLNPHRGALEALAAPKSTR